MKNLLFSDKMALVGLLLIQKFSVFAQKESLVDSVRFAGGTTSVVYKNTAQADDMAILMALNGSFSMNEEVKISVSQAKPTAQTPSDPVPQKVDFEAAKPIEINLEKPVAEQKIEQKIEPKKSASTSKMANGKTNAAPKSTVEKSGVAQKSTAKTASKKSSSKKSFAKPMSKKRFRWPSVSLPSIGRDSSGRTGCYKF